MNREKWNQGWLFVNHPTISVRSLAHSDSMEGVPVELPHDAMIHEPRSADVPSQNQSGFYPGGTYCYLKRFTVPEEWRAQKCTLEFEGVYKNATVYVNGALAGGCRNGYTEFLVETDGLLRYGEENEIKVMVNNEGQPSSRWYSGSGLYRGVNLLRAARTHITSGGARLHTAWLDEQLAVIELRVELANEEPNPVRLTYTAELLDVDGNIVASDTLPLTMYGHTLETLIRSLQIHKPKLWDCEQPYLYTYRVRLTSDGRELDCDEGRIGVRTLALDSARGLLLNAKPIKLRGSCIHHDNGILGACAFEQAEARRVRILKEAGFNCIRSAHNPISRAMLDACDAQGILVMDEYSDVWTLPKNAFDDAAQFEQEWRNDLTSLVRKDYNHPSVMLYCLGNEIPEAGTEHGAWLCRQMNAAIKQLDDTRLTANATNALLACSSRMREIIGDIMKDRMPAPQAQSTGGMDAVSAVNSFASMLHGPLGDAIYAHSIVTEMLAPFKDATDVTGLNYMPSRHALERELNPDRLVLGTEEYPPDIVRLWGLVKQYPHVIGDMTWTGYDYIGEAGIGIFYYDGSINMMPHWPDRLANVGDITILGDRRPISYLREIVYGLRKQPYIAVMRMDRDSAATSCTTWMFKDNLASWTWHGFEGQPASVDVYSDAEQVDLLLNGVSQGIQPAGEANNFTASFTIPYKPGILMAKAIRNGQPAEEFLLETADKEVQLCAMPEGDPLALNLGELLFVPVRLTDSVGRENPQAQRQVSVEVEGSAALQAFGSASPSGEESYDDTVWSTYDGCVMAVIRAAEAGTARVTFSAVDCAPVSLDLRIR